MSLRRYSPRVRPSRLLAFSAAAVAAALACATSSASAATTTAGTSAHHDTTRFYVPPPDPGAITQIKDLLRHGHLKDALGVARMVTTPQAVWFDGGTPAQVRSDVRRTVEAAARRGTVPVLVAYNLPFRDCAQYSAGGATDTDAYLTWISAFAAGIGKHKAWVMLEPDGLGIIPNNVDLNGNAEWCQPTAPGATPAERYRALNGAVDRLTAHKATRVYLDGTHSAWLGVGDIAHRLVLAGVQKARRLLPQRLELPDHLAAAALRHVDLGVHRLRPRRGGALQELRQPVLPRDRERRVTWHLTDEWYAANLVRRRPDHALRDRHQPQRAGPVDAPARGSATPRCGATRPAAASACGPRPGRATRSPTPSSGSRRRASPTASASGGPRARSIRSGASSTRPQGSGSRRWHWSSCTTRTRPS